jgi:diguanylate cyclase (GGDEF)-like protein
MGLFGRLKLLIGDRPPEFPPPEIYRALVDDLHAPLISLIAGATTTVLVGSIAAWRTDNFVIAALTILTALVTAARILMVAEYRRSRRAEPANNDVAVLRRFERRYAIGATVYAGLLGLTALVAYVFTDDPVSFLLITANLVGYSAGATGRNSCRPNIAVAQNVLLLVPIIIGTALRLQAAYAVMSLITVLYLISSIEIVRYLGANRLRLLLTTREKAALAKSLAEQIVLLDTALNNMALGLCMFDAGHRLRIANRRFLEMFHIQANKIAPGTPMQEVMKLAQNSDSDPAYAEAAQQRLLEDSTTPILTTLADGRMISISHRPMPDGGIVATFEDVTEQRRVEAHARFLATHDSLTGLPNRVVFGQELNAAVELGHREGRHCAVLFVNLDRFKIINDTLGHLAGDTLLIEIAGRIVQCVGSRDLVARIGGDDFVILLRHVSDSDRVANVARKILAAVVRPMTLNGQECRVTASIGASLFPSDANDEVTLTKNAEAAMYAAKEAGRNTFVVHSEEIKTQSIERLMLETGLRRALERNEFVLYYQPKRDLKGGGISGVEALLRWRHPDLGLLLPNQFVPLAEETGLIVPIGRWVLARACAQNMQWQREGLPAIRVAVNLSPRQFADSDLLNDIRDALEHSGMPPSLLELEITESMVMRDLPRTVQLMQEIKHLGITLAIDDFGTGYSSMAMVRELPIDSLKIDRSFVRDVRGDAEGNAFIHAIIALGHALDLTVVAEGVETEEQEAFLREQKCDEEQGYLISAPLPASEFAAFLAEQTRAKLRAQAADVASSRSRARPTGTLG